MAKLVLAMFTSLDGCIEGADGTFRPPPWSDEVERNWSHDGLSRARHLVYGRRNFLFNREFWTPAETDPNSIAASISYAGTMNRMPKTVFSTTLEGEPGWNATLARGDAPGTVARLKATVDGDIFCFGGAGLARTMIAHDLPDEYRIMVTPTIFGSGKRLFADGLPALDLELIDLRRLDTGSVIVHYRRPRAN
jgi:dihydrofolate reductase